MEWISHFSRLVGWFLVDRSRPLTKNANLTWKKIKGGNSAKNKGDYDLGSNIKYLKI